MKSIGLNEQQLQKMKSRPGFIAALDQSGGSTPKALALYGIKEGAWSNEDEMFAIVHQMRTRMITGPGLSLIIGLGHFRPSFLLLIMFIVGLPDMARRSRVFALLARPQRCPTDADSIYI